ncbi:protein ASPARTIC PROTEASE IN GUARD CELL 2-like [Mercurialis annua]|uniref:protein ASPARTIC PROTEASE IN GUARD CELL 2-like n=1 Tax=Mercurialis annua TaxID=3986 RepID=UPI00215F4FD7|nr:protein ASPARTIC PROTEASE IN GUARD CELL 2-like [Mercurialis annua]
MTPSYSFHLLLLFVPTLYITFSNHNVTAKSLISFPIHHIGKFANSFFNNSNSFNSYRLSRDQDRFKTPLVTRLTGEHVVQVRIGVTEMQTHLFLDTRSPLIWWQCFPCLACFNQINDPKYQYDVSLSYDAVDVSSSNCNSSERFIDNEDYNDDQCHYDIEYGNGGYSTGVLSTEILSTEDRVYSQNITFGCGRQNSGHWYHHGLFAGIMGFNKNNYAFPSQLNATKFSFCLVNYDWYGGILDKKSQLYLHEFPELKYDSFFVPLLESPYDPESYYVEFTGIKINGDDVSVKHGVWNPNSGYGVVVDTGTLITRFPRDVYTKFRDQFVAEASDEFDPIPSYDHFLDVCYELDPEFQLHRFPTVSLYFGGGDKYLKLLPEQILYSDTAGVYCFAFLPYDRNATILGSHQLEKTRFSFDLSGKTVIISPNDC